MRINTRTKSNQEILESNLATETASGYGEITMWTFRDIAHKFVDRVNNPNGCKEVCKRERASQNEAQEFVEIRLRMKTIQPDPKTGFCVPNSFIGV